MKEMNEKELEKVNGGIAGIPTYVASVFWEGIDEHEVDGYFDHQDDALYAAYDELRNSPDRFFVIRIYTYDFSTGTKTEVYSEEIDREADDYYRKLR